MILIIFFLVVLVVPTTIAVNPCHTRSCIECLREQGCLFAIDFNEDGICGTYEEMDTLQVSHIITHLDHCNPNEVADREPLPFEVITKEHVQEPRPISHEAVQKMKVIPEISPDAPIRKDRHEMETSGAPSSRPSTHLDRFFTAKLQSNKQTQSIASRKTHHIAEPTTHTQTDNKSSGLTFRRREHSGTIKESIFPIKDSIQTSPTRPPGYKPETTVKVAQSNTQEPNTPKTLADDSTSSQSPLLFSTSIPKTYSPGTYPPSPPTTTTAIPTTQASNPTTPASSYTRSSPTTTSTHIKRKCQKETQLERFRRSMCRNYELFKKLKKKNLVSEYSLWAQKNPMLYKTTICEDILKKMRACRDMKF